MNWSKPARCALTDVTAILALVIISVLATLWLHLPAATSFILLLAIELLALAYPLSVLANEKKTPRRKMLIKQQLIFEVVGFGLLTAALAYGNYLLFFVRHHTALAYMDPANPLHRQAITLVYAVMILCQLQNLAFTRVDERKKLFTRRLISNQALLRAFAISLFVMLNIVYNPLLKPIFGTHALDLIDWLMIIASGGLYGGARVVQRHSRQYTRHVVFLLHKEAEKAQQLLH
jgi:magnesium-transporting ATPase (P-type)